MVEGLPIVDAHQHFWDPTANHHPWLCDEPPIPFRYGDYRAIRRPYLPEHYFADAAGFDVVGTVYVETEWDPTDPVGEIRWVDALRRRTGFPTVAVGQAWLGRADCAATLEALAGFDFVRGVRQKPRANPRPQDTEPGGMTDPVWRAGFARLAPLGLRFDLQTPWWHFDEAARLATDFPATQIVVNHCGMPADRSAAGLDAWRAACARLAACPNVAIKLSGIGQAGLPWTVAANRPIVEALLALFGPARCMVGSNFPVDSLCGDYPTIVGGLRALLGALSPAEQRAVLHDTANRVYAMGLPA